jgi:hypothetical protein
MRLPIMALEPGGIMMDENLNAEQDEAYTWGKILRELTLSGGRMAIGYVVADQLCRYTLGSPLMSLMPQLGDGGGMATFVALYAADRGIRQGIHAVSEKLGLKRPKRDLPAEATARLNGGVWLVSGFESGEIVAMGVDEFKKFEAQLAKAGRDLIKIMPSTTSILKRSPATPTPSDAGLMSDEIAVQEAPTLTTTRYRGGKFHCDDGPAVTIAKLDGYVLRAYWFLAGNQMCRMDYVATRMAADEEADELGDVGMAPGR